MVLKPAAATTSKMDQIATEPKMGVKQERQLVIDCRRSQQPEYFLDCLVIAASVIGAHVLTPDTDQEDPPRKPALTYLPPHADRFQFAQCARTQRFPGMRQLCNKVPLARLFQQQRVLAPNSNFGFTPQTWILPEQSEALEVEPDGWFIVKPNAGTRGQGISLHYGGAAAAEGANAEEAADGVSTGAVAQQYIPPLLWPAGTGQKWDLRLYVLVTAVAPRMEAALFCTGIARLCSSPYSEPSPQNCANNTIHLSNTAINAVEDEACKQPLDVALELLAAAGCDTDALWAQIRDEVIGNTLCLLQPSLSLSYGAAFGPKSNPSRCYQVLGFDVMLDSDARPFLLEINANPSFALPTELDAAVKPSIIATALSNVLGVEEWSATANVERVGFDPIAIPELGSDEAIMHEAFEKFDMLKSRGSAIGAAGLSRIENAVKRIKGLEMPPAFCVKQTVKSVSWEQFVLGLVQMMATVDKTTQRPSVLRKFLRKLT